MDVDATARRDLQKRGRQNLAIGDDDNQIWLLGANLLNCGPDFFWLGDWDPEGEGGAFNRWGCELEGPAFGLVRLGNHADQFVAG